MSSPVSFLFSLSFQFSVLQILTCEIFLSTNIFNVGKAEVPPDRYGGDHVYLTIRFVIKGQCIRAVKEVTGLSREESIKLLTKTHGSAGGAAENYFNDEAIQENGD